MIAADTSAWVDYLGGVESNAARALGVVLENGHLVMVPPVLMEVLSGSSVDEELEEAFRNVPLLELKPRFWERAGHLRGDLLKNGKRARSLDCLIAQSCIDYDVPLITADKDFHNFISAGLKLV